jgi:hypothetical protein
MIIRNVGIVVALSSISLAVQGAIILENKTYLFNAWPASPETYLAGGVDGSITLTEGDYSVGNTGFATLVPDAPYEAGDTKLEINNGSTLQAGTLVYSETNSSSDLDLYKSDIIVDGVGSVLEMANHSEGTGAGSIILLGKSDLNIVNGGKVQWAATNDCSNTSTSCDIIIGGGLPSNSGIVIAGEGSELDASNTHGQFILGSTVEDRSVHPNDPGDLTDDYDSSFLAVIDKATLKTNNAEIASADVSADKAYSVVIIDDASWDVTSSADESAHLNIGTGNGATANVFIQNAAQVSVTGENANIQIGQVPVDGIIPDSTDLVLITGLGSKVIIDNNANENATSRIADAFVSVQNEGQLLLDSSSLLISGSVNNELSLANLTHANIDHVGTYDPNPLPEVNSYNLDVFNGGSVTITDNEGLGQNALIIGQTPGGTPVQSANVRVSGVGSNITVTNDSSVNKIALTATNGGVPSVSNIGTGSLLIEDGGSVNINHGDFVIGAGVGDDAVVYVNGAGSSLNADRIVVGLSDFEGATVGKGNNKGQLILSNGTINGDVVIDDNGILSGIGNINGTLYAEGGFIGPGFSPGTISFDELILGDGATLFMEIGIDEFGNIDFENSDRLIAKNGVIDLSLGNVIFDLFFNYDISGIDIDDILFSADSLNLGGVFAFFGDPEGKLLYDVNTFSLTSSSSVLEDRLPTNFDNIDMTASAVPEPSTLAIFVLALIGLRLRQTQKFQ